MSERRGLLIVNLGSPDSYSVPDLRKYLSEFLMDERVIDMPYLLRSLVVRAFIVPFRAPKSAKAYETVWTKRGSPLKVITEEFTALVQAKVNMPVSIAMRYGNPTPEQALKELGAGGLDELLIAPMYPHYAMSSTETAVEHVKSAIRKVNRNMKVRVLKPFFNEPAYIASLAESIQPLSKDDFDGYLFSYHGLPVRHLKKTDPTRVHCYSSNDCCEIKSIAWDTCYKHQVKTTTRLVADKLGLDKSKVHISFQSRLGSDEWIQPFTDKELEELPKRGVKKLLVLCPAFVADCLETLEEMDERGKEIFMKNGGEVYVRVPCLNTSAQWVDTFAAYCNDADGAHQHLWKSEQV
jgi:protoporphyrin/coproporphyrin ferrochelatase